MATSGVELLREPPGRKLGAVGFAAMPFRNLLRRIGENGNFPGEGLPVVAWSEIGGGRVCFDSIQKPLNEDWRNWQLPGWGWRKAALEARGRILDRGHSFQPLEGMRTYCEEPKKAIF